MELLSIQTGKPEKTPAKTGPTGHFKKPVDGPVAIHRLGLDGDAICDLKNHGGVDQAVYLFGTPDLEWWTKELGRETPPGFFGENLVISDLDTSSLAIGDILTIGDVTLQITAPRIPCATYAAHIGDGRAIKQFYAAERPGAYARVLKEGSVSKGMKVDLASYDGDRITVVDYMRAYRTKFKDEDFLRRVLALPAPQKLHAIAKERLGI
ncbi:MOSC domain-containing protein [Cognatiyoonia sp. IB215446]|uniref:MOSC domain-containing protein n=1 Tax=Cognatiyoonia sp. IB215446 TaxID=3097355 RepID=UPI002A0CDA2F|nr:MOSC domain-containing protein [Cognatiyoonia sp. IB215446]MDX8349716.1 MOSC domain-containing protein [Cognatiyoonia sp. IB215446]